MSTAIIGSEEKWLRWKFALSSAVRKICLGYEQAICVDVQCFLGVIIDFFLPERPSEHPSQNQRVRTLRIFPMFISLALKYLTLQCKNAAGLIKRI